MVSRSATSLRLFTFAILAGLVLSAAQSCAKDDAKPTIGPPGGEIVRDGSAERGEGEAGTVGAAATSSTGQPAVDGPHCGDAGECPTGFLCCTPCCTAGRPPVCMRAVGGQCPLPDLEVSQAALSTNLALDTVDAGACELQERCLAGEGQRRVLRFDVRVPNTGVVDLVLGNPDAGGQFEYAACHKHYHFRDFAEYKLLDDTGNTVVVGRKQAFCARDSARVGKDAGFNPRYDCNEQGIQRGWEDIYDPSLPCQYLDVTDLPSGTYWVEVEVNPGRAITELRYDNNRATAKVVLP
jgi:hypothetical protein